MTRKSTTTSKGTSKKPKKLSLSKQTLKDLSVRGDGPKGGRIKTDPTGPCSF